MARKSDPKVRERWLRIVAEYDSFEGTVAEFCAKHDVSANSFFSWRRKLRGQVDDGQRRGGGFVPVQVTGTLPDAMVQVHLPGGARVEFAAAHRELLLEMIERLSENQS